MNLKRVKAICGKETIQIMRDPRSLALGLAIPVILIVLFGFALSLDIQDVPMGVWDQDNTKASVDFLLNFKNSHYFKIIGYYDSYRPMEKLINYGDAMMAMTIPKDFSRYIYSNQQAPIQLILDGSDSNTATISLGYASTVVFNYNQNILTNAFKNA